MNILISNSDPVRELVQQLSNISNQLSIDEALIVAEARLQLADGLALDEDTADLLRQISIRKPCAQTAEQVRQLQSRCGKLVSEIENEFLQGLLKRVRCRGNGAIFSEYERANVEYLHVRYIQRPSAKLQ